MADVLSTYRGVLSYPGAAAFTFAGLLSRLPISMFNISVILMVQIEYGSYEMAGRVAAVGIAVWAAQTLPTAQLVDRWGQRNAMLPLLALFAIGSVLAIWTAVTHGPEWLLLLATALASVTGPLGSLTRARWSHLLHSEKEIHTAFSLEGALDEVLFIGGPALATVLATTVWSGAGLVVCVVGCLIGASILLAQTHTQPPRRLPDTGQGGLGLKIPGAVIAVSLVATGLGLVFGAGDIATVGFADQLGFKSISGALIGAIAVGSFTGGLLYGARHWHLALWVRTVVGAGALAVGYVALSTSPNLVVFAVLGFLTGVTIAPTMTNIDTVVQRVVRRDQITEGMAWVRIGMGIGVAVGSWVAGIALDRADARAGLAVAAASGVLTFVLAVSTIPLLRRGTQSKEGRDAVDAVGEDTAAPVP